MVALRILASVIFAAIFLSIFASLYFHYQSGGAEANFRRDAEQLAQQIGILSGQDPGSPMSFKIEVPSGCELRFEDNSVIIIIGGELKNFDAGVAVSGPKLSGQTAELTLERTENRVVISV